MTAFIDAISVASSSELGAIFERHVLATFGFEATAWSDTWPRTFERLSDGLTVDRVWALRAQVSGAWGDDEARLVATLAFGQRTFLSALALLRGYGGEPGPVLDLGSGSGAAGLAATACGARRVTLLDADAETVAWGARLVAGPGVEVVSQVGDLLAAPIADDIRWVVAAFSLNEVVARRPSVDGRLGEILSGWLAPGRRVLVLEPGTHEAARRLQRARDGLYDRHKVLGPCTHALPCPMLRAGERDWCHLTRPSLLGPLARRIIRTAGRDDTASHLSWLALGDGHGAAGESRVLDARASGKGKVRLLACDGQGLRELTVLTRHDTPMASVEPGAVIRVPVEALEVKGDGARVARPELTQVVRPL